MATHIKKRLIYYPQYQFQCPTVEKREEFRLLVNKIGQQEGRNHFNIIRDALLEYEKNHNY